MIPTILITDWNVDALAAWVTGSRAGLETRALRRAIAASLEAHEGQVRENGDPAISHPLNVARLLAHGGADETTTIAGVLHDVAEDTEMTLRELRLAFGPAVADVVALLTKPCRGVAPSIMNLICGAQPWRQATFRALRVKIADRLDNMATVAALPLFRQRKLAIETLGVLCAAAAAFDPVAAKRLRRLSHAALAPRH